MLTKETIKNLNLPMNRFSSSGAKTLNFRVRKPKDKRDLLVGYLLKNRYYILSVIGKGGMSLVYKAKDFKHNRIVAVKALRTQGLGDETIVKRFQLEAEVLHRLNHPRIVSVYDYGTSRIGQPWFVMDYLTGVSLSQVLRKHGRLSLERFQDIFVQVSAAVAHAHKHKAIHRDLKPGNIMLVEMGDTLDYVKIVDFGIAKLAEDASKLTRLGEVWGSPIYMSPEQGMGKQIDTRTDIYSLGIVMYEALTGEVPFLGKNYVETMTKQMTEPPPPFSEIAPDVDIPASLEMIIFKALQKSPDDRYQTMQELKGELERALSPTRIEPSKSKKTTTGEEGHHQVWRFIKDKMGQDEHKATVKTPRKKDPPVEKKPKAKTFEMQIMQEDFITTFNRPQMVSASPPDGLLQPSEFVQRQSQKLKALPEERKPKEPLSSLVDKDHGSFTTKSELNQSLIETIDPGSIKPEIKIKEPGEMQEKSASSNLKTSPVRKNPTRKRPPRKRPTMELRGMDEEISKERNKRKDSHIFKVVILFVLAIAIGFGIAASNLSSGFINEIFNRTTQSDSENPQDHPFYNGPKDN